jgi:hypothetical protein
MQDTVDQAYGAVPRTLANSSRTRAGLQVRQMPAAMRWGRLDRKARWARTQAR